jgi:hypothetical protein
MIHAPVYRFVHSVIETIIPEQMLPVKQSMEADMLSVQILPP